MENQQLNIIIEHLEQQEEILSQFLKKKPLKEEKSLIYGYLETSKKYYHNFILCLTDKSDELKIELENTNENLLQLNRKLPVKINNTYHFDRNSRNELWLGAIGIIFFIVIGLVSINHFRDNTNYKKAWGELMDKKMTAEQRLYFNSILKEVE